MENETNQPTEPKAPNKFPVEKTLKLDFLGAGWNTGAQLVFSGLTFAQTKELAASVDLDDANANEKNFELVVKFLTDHFIRGNAWNGTTLVNITSEELVDLPVEVINAAVKLLSGATDPKS